MQFFHIKVKGVQFKMKKFRLDLIDLIAIIILIGIPLLCLYVFKFQTTTTFIIFGALLILSILFMGIYRLMMIKQAKIRMNGTSPLDVMGVSPFHKVDPQ